ncbi:peptidylglycine alpha-hydroxylating monooxygenase [Anthonomus grandis grandis]|uniref:peptidylglycine alpha-hydroxylating monooxygenase n=1 Tax=Anthonomus grandis grandis TaxID=2921223 RepID=UPI0021656499|nr:peptidylglycine alpha-hydroxylating monooxygenase [Anthonomus grandis grandis]
MAVVHMFSLMLFYVFSLFISMIWCSEFKKYPMLMPAVHPHKDDFYVCTPIKIVPDKNFYIVGFEPNATMNVVHHMLLFGCSSLASFDEYWDCGEMAETDNDSSLQKATPCAQGSHVIYAWARNAKPLKLPEDVGFLIGKDTPIKYLVLQIHYMKKFAEGETDSSGLFLMYTQRPQSKLAAVLLLASGGRIPPNEITHMDVACRITENKVIYPFAYRTHTHSLGRVVSGYRVTREEGLDRWHLLGKRDPLTPQMFYPVFDKTPIKPGDKIAARCTMDSTTRNRFTEVGPTNNDEMCNFYLMYYVERGTPLEIASCYDVGPPNFYWNNNEDLNNIPEEEASSLY